MHIFPLLDSYFGVDILQSAKLARVLPTVDVGCHMDRSMQNHALRNTMTVCMKGVARHSFGTDLIIFSFPFFQYCWHLKLGCYRNTVALYSGRQVPSLCSDQSSVFSWVSYFYSSSSPVKCISSHFLNMLSRQEYFGSVRMQHLYIMKPHTLWKDICKKLFCKISERIVSLVLISLVDLAKLPDPLFLICGSGIIFERTCAYASYSAYAPYSVCLYVCEWTKIQTRQKVIEYEALA